ncbi:hypothetical protein [Kocuria flava]|uniref:hypothetical protein n=1 Tax=Kocuria flava TaxID=446860 RepID=UPI002F9478DC
MKKELQYAAFISSGALLLGLATWLISSGVFIPGFFALTATVALLILLRRRIKDEQGEEALRAADEYDRLHRDDTGETHGRKGTP